MDSISTKDTTSDNLNLFELLHPIWKWWWLVIISALLAGFSSALYTRLQPEVYLSSTTLMVGTALSDPNPNSGEFGLASQLAATYVDLATRSAVQDGTKNQLGISWLPDYEVRQIPNTQLIEISVVDTVPERAQAVALALVDQLILQSPGGQAQQERQQFIDAQLLALQQAIDETTAEMEQLDLALAKMYSARQIADTRTQLQALETKRSMLQGNYAAMLGNSSRGGTNTIAVIEAARLPLMPLNNDLRRNVAIAMLLGGAMAGAGTYVLESFSNSLKSAQDVQKRLALPCLGALPHGDKTAKHAEKLISTLAHRTELGDAYAALRLNIQAMLHRRGLHTLAISCPVAEDRRPAVAANLCIELARSGTTVILVDTDLHRPAQQHLFGLPNHAGLVTLLSDEMASVEEMLQATAIPGLRVLTSGPLPANSVSLLGSDRMQNRISQLRQLADLVVFDLPPVNAVVDASLVAIEVDGVVLTLVAERTRERDIKQALQILNHLDIAICGTVLCDLSASAVGHEYGVHAQPQAVEPLLRSSEPTIPLHLPSHGNAQEKSMTSALSSQTPTHAASRSPSAPASITMSKSGSSPMHSFFRRNPLGKA